MPRSSAEERLLALIRSDYISDPAQLVPVRRLLREVKREELLAAAERAGQAFGRNHPNYIPHVAGEVRAAILRREPAKGRT
jgi:hypothetical protein